MRGYEIYLTDIRKSPILDKCAYYFMKKINNATIFFLESLSEEDKRYLIVFEDLCYSWRISPGGDKTNNNIQLQNVLLHNTIYVNIL